MKAVVTDKWILCPVCGAKTRTQILDDTELKHFPLFVNQFLQNFSIFPSFFLSLKFICPSYEN